jgi:hypothetical protein
MTGIVISLRKLKLRRQVLQRIFENIARTTNVTVFFRSSATTTVIGLGPDTFGDQLRRARLPSRVQNIFLNYFEVWTIQKGGREFQLEKAYMHLDKPFPDGSGDEEVLALHCDPVTPQYDPAFVYKRGPHLHVSSNKTDISKAHIALCHGKLESACSDYEAFSTAITAIVQMINAELLPKFAGTA